jgi:hypothetical protein
MLRPHPVSEQRKRRNPVFEAGRVVDNFIGWVLQNNFFARGAKEVRDNVGAVQGEVPQPQRRPRPHEPLGHGVERGEGAVTNQKLWGAVGCYVGSDHAADALAVDHQLAHAPLEAEEARDA